MHHIFDCYELLLLSADSLCKEFGTRTGRACSVFSLFATLKVFQKECYEEFNLEISADGFKACNISMHAKN